MRIKVKKRVLLIPLALLAIIFLLVLLADSWLESNTGKRRLESALERSLGMPVDLRGEFNITLLPSPGISGTDLTIGATEAGSPLIQSSEYHVTLELLPLIEGELKVLSVRAAEGLLDASRFADVGMRSDNSGPTEFRLPDIESLLLENIRLVFPGQSEVSLLVENLELAGFKAGSASPLSLQLSLQSPEQSLARLTAQSELLVSNDLGQVSFELETLSLESESLQLEGIKGEVSWQADQAALDARISWSDENTGSADLRSRLSTADVTGMVQHKFIPTAQDQALELALAFEPMEQGYIMDEIQLTFGQQAVTGEGCLLTVDDPALHLVLSSEFIDLESLDSLLPDGSEAPSEAPDDMPIDLNATLNVQELRAAGAIIRNAEFSLGHPIPCEIPAAPPAQMPLKAKFNANGISP
jgi:hypothetical protein